MKNSKITKIVYTIIGLITTVFVFGQDEDDSPTPFEEDVIDNAPIDDYLVFGVLIAVLFAIYIIKRNNSLRDFSIKKEEN